MLAQLVFNYAQSLASIDVRVLKKPLGLIAHPYVVRAYDLLTTGTPDTKLLRSSIAPNTRVLAQPSQESQDSGEFGRTGWFILRSPFRVSVNALDAMSIIEDVGDATALSVRTVTPLVHW